MHQTEVFLASRVVVVHAVPGGATERLCHDLLAAGKPVFAVDGPENVGLFALGALPLQPGVLPG